MLKSVKAGDTIKLNGAMFKDNFAPNSHFGHLGYPGIMRDWAFKVVHQFNHASHGNMLECVTVNVVGAQGSIYLRQDDCVPAILKRTIEYHILDSAAEKFSLQRQLDPLKEERQALLKSGKYKSGGRKLTANKIAMESLTASIANVGSAQKVYLPKIKKTVEVPAGMIDNKEELEMFLSGFISDYRMSFKKESVKEKTVLGHKVTLVGGIHTKPNVYGTIYEKTLETYIDQDKKPTSDKDSYIGIEIECLVKCTREELRKKFISARLHKNVQITTDSSIDVCADGYNPFELRVLVTEGELERVVMAIHRILKARDVDGYVNRSCGLHVHLDMRLRDVNESYSKLFNVQSLLRKAQPTARQVSSYCRPNGSDTFKECERRDQERYSVINTAAYKKLKTLEIRVHEGSVNGVAIINWCKFLVGVLNSNISTPVKTVAELEKLSPNIPRAGLDYISSRIAEFGDEEVVA